MAGGGIDNAYSEKVKCPRRNDGKVDERAESSADHNERDGQAGLQTHRVERCFKPGIMASE